MSARRRATVVPLPTSVDEPFDGGDLERIAGHVRGIVSALREFDVDTSGLDPDQAERRSWLYDALLDAVDHEQDQLEKLATMVHRLVRR